MRIIFFLLFLYSFIRMGLKLLSKRPPHKRTFQRGQPDRKPDLENIEEADYEELVNGEQSP
ncbi:MAG: hypothetical protein WD266_04200 [Balneolales bacterium]